VTFAQPHPWWALIAVLAVIAAIAWRAGWWAGAQAGPPATTGQRATLVALRALTLLALLAIVMRPVRLTPDPSAQGTFAILLDASRSMGLADTETGARTRLDAAKALVRDRLLPAIGGRFGVDVLTFGEDVRSVPADQVSQVSASAPATDVNRALEAVRRRAAAQTLAGVFVVSDGGFALPEIDVTSSRLDVPVYTLGVGGDVVSRDREVRQLTAGEATVANTAIDLTATVASAGFGTEPIEVRLSASGRPLETRRVAPAGDGVPTEVVFRVAPDATTATLYTVETVPQEGELTVDNNRRSVLVAPPGRARRVLLLEGAPGFEHSFLKRALDQDRGLELDSVVRKGANEQGDETYYVQAPESRARALTSGFPASRQSLFFYDALVLANVDTDRLSRDQLALVAEYVSERGGGLLVLGSRSLEPAAVTGTALEELLPVEVSDRRAAGLARAELATRPLGGVALTADGERHPVMRLADTTAETRTRWANLPPLPAVASVGGARPGATVLAYTAGPGGMSRPLVAIQRYGRGRVLTFTGEAAWRWRMMLPSTDTTYPTFWRQATRWLASSTTDPISLRTRSTGPGRLEVLVDARDENFRPVRDADVQLRVAGTDGPSVTVKAAPERDANGTYRAEVRLPAGAARIDVDASARGTTLGRATGWALAGPDDAELIEPRRNDAQLKRLAERFGGRLLQPADAASIVNDVRIRRASTAALIEHDAWHTSVALACLVALLVLEWSLRRSWGLR
jgi:uncharacterized membrane protein